MNALPDLDTHLLRAFIAVADIGSMSGAAKRLARTQAAVSTQVRKLEDSLQQKLLDRSSSGVRLTDAGTTLIPFARQILGTGEAARRALSQLTVGGRVRVGLVEDVTIAGLPDQLATFSAAYPDIILEIDVDASDALQEKLANGALDVAVTFHSPEARKPYVAWERLLNWVAAPGYALDTHYELPLVVLNRALPDPGCEALLAALDQAGFRFRIVVSTKSLSALLATVSAGLGLGIVVDQVALAYGLRPVPEKWGLPAPGRLAFGLFTTHFTATDPAALALAKFLGSALERP